MSTATHYLYLLLRQRTHLYIKEMILFTMFRSLSRVWKSDLRSDWTSSKKKQICSNRNDGDGRLSLQDIGCNINHQSHSLEQMPDIFHKFSHYWTHNRKRTSCWHYFIRRKKSSHYSVLALDMNCRDKSKISIPQNNVIIYIVTISRAGFPIFLSILYCNAPSVYHQRTHESVIPSSHYRQYHTSSNFNITHTHCTAVPSWAIQVRQWAIHIISPSDVWCVTDSSVPPADLPCISIDSRVKEINIFNNTNCRRFFETNCTMSKFMILIAVALFMNCALSFSPQIRVRSCNSLLLKRSGLSTAIYGSDGSPELQSNDDEPQVM